MNVLWEDLINLQNHLIYLDKIYDGILNMSVFILASFVLQNLHYTYTYFSYNICYFMSYSLYPVCIQLMIERTSVGILC
jgi:hypothetical protein